MTLKVIHNKCIILLRVSRDSELTDVRRRIQEKFLSQEDVRLTESFTLAVVLPSASGRTLGRSNSLTSVGGQMALVAGEGDWERTLLSTEGSKITLRVLDTL